MKGNIAFTMNTSDQQAEPQAAGAAAHPVQQVLNPAADPMETDTESTYDLKQERVCRDETQVSRSAQMSRSESSKVPILPRLPIVTQATQ